MPNPGSRPLLYVEGADDSHAIRHLLIRHGVDYDRDPWPGEYPRIEKLGGKPALLESFETAIRVSNNRSVGFVLDANSSLQDCWNAVSSRLRNVGVDAPGKIPRGGFVGEAETYRARVGVWIIPDNRRDGALEDFLRDLIDEEDPLLPHAEQSTNRAKELGACFPENGAGKAVLHTWLAWQREPGLPYGTAMRARYFRDDSPAARAFVGWFRAVFNVPRP